MKHISILLAILLFVTGANAQVATGNTQFGADGGGSIHAECTELLNFANYDDNLAGGASGQNFAFALLNGDSLYMNVKRTGNQVYSLAPPSTMGTCFGQFGYTGLTQLSDLYEYSYGSFTLSFTNIILKDAAHNVVPYYTMMAFDGEGTGNGEQMVFTAPAGHNWYDWDSVSTPVQICTPARSGEGTNVAKITGDCNSTYYTDFGFAVDSPGSIIVNIIEGTSGKEAVVLGIKRIITAPDDTLCSNGPTNININPVNASTGTTYTWPAPVVSPAGSITGGTAQATAVTSISQTFTNTTGAPASITYTLTPVSCGITGNPFTATIVLLPLHSAGSTQNICGTTATMAASGSGTWSAGGANPTAAVITNPTNPATTITGMTVFGNYQFIWTTTGGCTDTVTLVVGNAGTPPLISANDTIICAGDSATICAPAGYSTYFWNTGASTVCINTSIPSNYTVTVTSGIGCSAVSAPLGITVLPPVNAGADQTICGNSATMAATGTGSWTAVGSNPVTAAITNPASATTTITGMTANGNYQFIWTNAGGCSDTVTIAVNDSAASPQLSANHTRICPGDSSQICAPAGFATYYWSTGDTSRCITTPYAGYYYVTVTENGGCSAVSNQLNISVITPSPVTVSVNGDTLFVYTEVSYQWYRNGTIIPGATSQTYIAGAAGNYTVKVIDTAGCSDFSNQIAITGIVSLESDYVSVYPNPSAGGWQLNVSDNLLGAQVQIFDVEGRLVFNSEIRNPHSVIQPDIASGIYWMRINSADNIINKRVVKL